MLSVGDVAPDFSAEGSDGRKSSLSELRGSVVVLYFFPRAFTPICTRETARFRDHHAEFSALGARIVGVSPDPVATQCEFGSRQGVQFPLLADPERRIASSYGVLWPLLPRVRRVTIKGAGHWVHSEQPETFLEVLRRFVAAEDRTRLTS